MITEKEYKDAIKKKEDLQETVNQYHKESGERFKKRLEDNPIFKDDELFYSATGLCPCGHGLAYPKNCGPHHYWDCSAILKGIPSKEVEHTGKLYFTFYNVKGESEHRGTTRGIFKPREN